MEYISLTIFFALIVGLLEWREWKSNKRLDDKYGMLMDAIMTVENQLDELNEFKSDFKSLSADFSSLKERMESTEQFIQKASTDLDTIIKEYEINGVPLGYDRTGKPIDFIEGL